MQGDLALQGDNVVVWSVLTARYRKIARLGSIRWPSAILVERNRLEWPGPHFIVALASGSGDFKN